MRPIVFRHLAGILGKSGVKRTLDGDLAAAERQQSLHLIACETVDAAELFSKYPPQIEHTKKRVLFDLALARGLHGNLVIRRYNEIPLPATYQPFFPETEMVARTGYFRYSTDDATNDWFMNFAHHDVFNGYGHFMFAQDEVQVAEHPVLACAREMMLQRTDGLLPRTVENNAPTPLLFRAAERTLRIDTRSIYGARFARAEPAVIGESAHVIQPPTRSNILAIEAPVSSGNPTYTRLEIQAALRTAYSGFRAVVLATLADRTPSRPVVIHTGNWGCGAYGGNRQLMLSIQMMAARLAGVSQVVFYCGQEGTGDVATFASALSKRFQFRPNARVDRVVNRLVRAAFRWGTPDGN